MANQSFWTEVAISMEPLRISAEETAHLIIKTLSERFPGTVFSVEMTDDDDGGPVLKGIDIIWVEGPSREEVEVIVDRFQGVTWDPRTGSLDSRCHLQVGPDGCLQDVYYDVDYIFCDGPTTVLFS